MEGFKDRMKVENMGAIGKLGRVSEKGGRVRLRPERRGREGDLERGFHLICAWVSVIG